MLKKFCVLGTDKRSVKLREMYISEKVQITSYDKAEVVIAPVPFSRDEINITGEILTCDELINVMSNTKNILFSGAISDSIKEKLNQNRIEFYDLFDIEEVAIMNAIPTAEGAICLAMENTEYTLHNSNVLITGYGRIGKILAKMLVGIGANVYCEARNEKDLAMIEAMGYNSVRLNDMDSFLGEIDIVYNTIPTLIFDETRLKLLKKDVLIIDLASNPGGVDFTKAKELEKNVIWALSLPGKVAPVSAAKYLKNAIDKLLK
ncbi:MAG: dipicolinate synthase subunit DpsA [Clostridia bacterium]|nr:dipicolinate synthase subunit DpsA [Clostridia bacterium]